MDTQLEFAKEALKRCDERGTIIALEECIKRIERQHEELRRVAEFANCMAKPVQYEDDSVYLQHLKAAHIFYSGLAKRSPEFNSIYEESRPKFKCSVCGAEYHLLNNFIDDVDVFVCLDCAGFAPPTCGKHGDY